MRLPSRFKRSQIMLPQIFQDRCSVDALKKDRFDLFQKLSLLKIGRVEDKETVHFCGLAWADQDTACVFLPRRTATGEVDHDITVAKLTMRALARFGRESTDRIGLASGAEGSTGLLATISELADDFIKYGIFSERTRYATKNSGKPQWARTVTREIVFLDADGSAVYPNIRTSRSKDSHESLLACVQAAVLLEISVQHSWWLEGLQGRQDELKRLERPVLPRRLWATHLRLLLPELYAARTIRLANALVSYLENNRERESGDFYYGVNDFHTVWEHMLRRTLEGVETGWNNRLPRPAYQRGDGNYDVQSRGLQTDIILRNATGLRIVDAKYYDATSVVSAPELADIVKQMFYEYALRSVTADVVTGCFVFPASENGDGPYSEISVQHRNGEPEDFFPRIDCFYLSVERVLKAFTEGRKLNLV